jgi:hypothetical protein
MSKFDELYEATINEAYGNVVLHRFKDDIPKSVIRKIQNHVDEVDNKLSYGPDKIRSYDKYEIADQYSAFPGQGGEKLGGFGVTFYFNSGGDDEKFKESDLFKDLAKKVQKELKSAKVSFYDPKFSTLLKSASMEFRVKRV